ncbi:MAG: hypothetical protein SGARI_003309 [Bacillariaceae sp.]
MTRASAALESDDAGDVVNGLSRLEQAFVDDCKADPSPHGYYGAFFQPCEFSFFQGACSDDSSKAVGNPEPNLHWFFQLQSHMDNNDWDELSSDDIPDIDDLLLWPDQCVGIAPRCYAIANQSVPIMDTLRKLFPDGIPDGATHVQVDCRSDALELGRVAYNVARGVDEGIGYIMGFVFLILFLHLLAISLCCFGCFRFCAHRQATKDQQVPVYHAIPTGQDKYDTAVTGLVKEGVVELSEKKKHQYYDSV